MSNKKNNILGLFSLVVISVAIFSCQKKDLEIDVVETKCDGFAIRNPTYEFVEEQCGDGNNGKTFQVSFDFDGDEDCLHLIDADVTFHDIDGNELNNVVHGPEAIPVDSSSVTVSGDEVTFTYCYHFTSLLSEDDLNYIQMTFHTENEQQDESNNIGVRINIPGAQVREPSASDIKEIIEVDSKQIQLFIFDDAAQDGDIISINVNQEWVFENKMITNDGEFVTLELEPGNDNFIMFYAVNEGDSSPNTLAGRIEDDGEPIEFDVTMNTGEVVYFEIRCQ